MLKITVEKKATTETLFILEGSLSGPWVTELHKVIVENRSQPDLIYLDLAYVHFADAQGLALLRELLASGVTIREASLFIRELLKTDTPSKT